MCVIFMLKIVFLQHPHVNSMSLNDILPHTKTLTWKPSQLQACMHARVIIIIPRSSRFTQFQDGVGFCEHRYQLSKDLCKYHETRVTETHLGNAEGSRGFHMPSAGDSPSMTLSSRNLDLPGLLISN